MVSYPERGIQEVNCRLGVLRDGPGRQQRGRLGECTCSTSIYEATALGLGIVEPVREVFVVYN